MTFDWDKKADPGAVAVAASVLQAPGSVERRTARHGRSEGLEGLETTGGLEGFDMAEGPIGGPSENERVERLGEALAQARPDEPQGDRMTLERAILQGARTGLAKAFVGEAPDNFTFGEHVGLEAVIQTNGERPSLFLKDGFVDLAAPDVGDWDWALGHFRNDILSVTAGVGRVDVPVKPGFAGTCFVIAEGLVATNRHVLEAIATQDGSGKWVLNWPDSTTVDFDAEDGATTSRRFPVTGVAFAGPDAINLSINFAHLDMAVLRVDAAKGENGAVFPAPLKIETNQAQPAIRRQLYVVGFPGQPRKWTFEGTPAAGTETVEVLSTIFNSRFGVKRLAPGEATSAPGGLANDAKGWVYAHDASTLGGNSGSCVVDLTDNGLKVIGLHFGGANRKQNWAHATSRLHEQFAGPLNGDA